MRSTPILVLALAAVSASACVDDPTSSGGTTPDAPADVQVAAFGLDARYAETAREVPGFGGAYYDDGGQLVVNMAGRSLATEGAQIRDQLREGLRVPARRGQRGGVGLLASTDIVLREAAFDYTQLTEFNARAGAVFGLDGAVYTDIDESANRIRVGIEAGADQAAFLDALAAQGVPPEAVTFTVTEPIEPLKGETLQDRVQPIGGGLQLVFPHPVPGYIYLCTLGFNVDGPEPGRSVNYFITNSHCTFDQGAVDGTPYYQQGLALPNEKYLAAHEVLDPEYFPCYGGDYVCRFSDAAMARYETKRTPVNHDAIYRPESVNTGSLDISKQGSKTFTIADEAPYSMLGDVLSKVGRTTGWTEGEVVGTCLNVLQSGSNRVILCQDYVAAGVGGGDSGSPVFMRDGESTDVTLYGVLWGGGGGAFVFSPMENIRYELGDFDLY